MTPEDNVAGCISAVVLFVLVVAANLALLAVAVWIIKAVWT